MTRQVWNRELGNTHFEELLEKTEGQGKSGLLHNKPLLKRMLVMLVKMLAGVQLSTAQLVVVTKPRTPKALINRRWRLIALIVLPKYLIHTALSSDLLQLQGFLCIGNFWKQFKKNTCNACVRILLYKVRMFSSSKGILQNVSVM